MSITALASSVVDTSLIATRDIVMPVTVKNTFLDVTIPDSASTANRRSATSSSCCGNFPVGGEDSTAASDNETSSTNYFDAFSSSDQDISPGSGTRTPTSEVECVECESDWMDSSSTMIEDASKLMIEVKQFDFVGNIPAKSKLKATARPFAPVRSLPVGIQSMIASAKDVLEKGAGVFGVQTIPGAMGGTLMLVALTRAPSRNPRYLLAIVKSALLASAERSRDAYIVGYDVKPFTKIDKCSLTTTLASLPDVDQKTACWDIYKNGYCSRRITCPWSHPTEAQVIRLVVRVQKMLDPMASRQTDRMIAEVRGHGVLFDAPI